MKRDLLAGLSLAIVTAPAWAQSPAACGGDDAALRRARAYAPIYWFSPGERYFPTIPFFSAFDGVDNDGDGQVDLADLDEVAPAGSGPGASWNQLDRWYRAPEPRDAPGNAIFYRVTDLSARQVGDMWRYLASDEQHWRRFDIDRSLLDSLRSPGVRFQVIEYYGYYLNDFGLIGHPYDVELVYVFLPLDEALANDFRVVVGGGHTKRIPNNVLVLSGEVAWRESHHEEPTRPPRRPNVLVELGDHSSSPDAHPYGAFHAGIDVNWHDHDVWGVRDVQASSGLGALGQYQRWMTFPREGSHSVRMFPAESILSRATIERDSDLRSEEHGADPGQYSLFSAELFACLYRAIDASRADAAAGFDEVEARIAQIVNESTWAWEFTGFEGLSEAQRRAAVGAMQRWLEGLTAGYVETWPGQAPAWSPSPGQTESIEADKHQIWRSPHYTGPPGAIFKQNLFRPVGSAMSFGDYLRQFTLSTGVQPSTLVAMLGYDLPASDQLLGVIPIRLPGYLSLQAGAYVGCRPECFSRGDTTGGIEPRERFWSPIAAATLTGHYNRLFTYYGRLAYIPWRDEVDRDVRDGVRDAPSARTGRFSIGLSIQPSTWLRLRVGGAIGVDFKGANDFEPEVVIELSRPPWPGPSRR